MKKTTLPDMSNSSVAIYATVALRFSFQNCYVVIGVIMKVKVVYAFSFVRCKVKNKV